jgi:hypothetical protein
MEKDLLDGKLGELAAYDVEFKGGKLVAKVSAEKSGVVAAVELSVDAAVVLDALKAAIPGQVDDAVIDLIKAALKA